MSPVPNEHGAADGVTLMDPRAARFGQTITMLVLVLGLALQEPLFIVAIAVILNAAVLSKWRLDLYEFIWKKAVIPLIGKPNKTEPAAPHRFAKLMGATMSAVASILLVAGPMASLPVFELIGYGVTFLLAGAAAIGGVGNYCIGCKIYRQVAFFRRLGVV